MVLVLLGSVIILKMKMHNRGLTHSTVLDGPSSSRNYTIFQLKQFDLRDASPPPWLVVQYPRCQSLFLIPLFLFSSVVFSSQAWNGKNGFISHVKYSLFYTVKTMPFFFTHLKPNFPLFIILLAYTENNWTEKKK